MLLGLAVLVMTPAGWQLPDQATQVQILRGSTEAYVAIADVVPTDRIKACDVEVAIGSRVGCPGSAPNSTSDWWPKSAIFGTPAPKTFSLRFRWTNPDKNRDGSPLNDFVGINAYVQRQDCDPVLSANCPVAPWSAPIWIGNVNEYVIEGVIYRACLQVQPVNELKAIAALSNTACGPVSVPEAVKDLRQE